MGERGLTLTQRLNRILFMTSKSVSSSATTVALRIASVDSSAISPKVFPVSIATQGKIVPSVFTSAAFSKSFLYRLFIYHIDELFSTSKRHSEFSRPVSRAHNPTCALKHESLPGTYPDGR